MINKSFVVSKDVLSLPDVRPLLLEIFNCQGRSFLCACKITTLNKAFTLGLTSRLLRVNSSVVRERPIGYLHRQAYATGVGDVRKLIVSGFLPLLLLLLL